MFQCSIVVI